MGVSLHFSVSPGPYGTSVTTSLWTGSKEDIYYQIHSEMKIVRLTENVHRQHSNQHHVSSLTLVDLFWKGLLTERPKGILAGQR